MPYEDMSDISELFTHLAKVKALPASDKRTWDIETITDRIYELRSISK
jgi:hypothetical protein